MKFLLAVPVALFSLQAFCSTKSFDIKAEIAVGEAGGHEFVKAKVLATRL